MRKEQYLDPIFGLDITEETYDFLCGIHSSKIIRVLEKGSGDFGIYRIKYSYQTRRGNRRTQEKFFFIPATPENGYVRAKKEFEKWVSCFNTDNPFRRIGRVRIEQLDEIAIEHAHNCA